MHAGAHDLGRRRSADRLDVRQLAVVDEAEREAFLSSAPSASAVLRTSMRRIASWPT
jgi:hypothetical protein